MGFGGTRYMPLFFSLHGLLIKLGLPPVAAGILLDNVVLILLLAGMYRLVRNIGAKQRLALTATLLTVASGAFLMLATSLRGDALSLALGIWGLAILTQGTAGGSKLFAAAFFFALAFFSKFSAVAAPAAGFFYLWFQVGKKHALSLTAMTFVLCLALLGIFQVLSAGRFWGIMRACAGGGMDIYSVSKAPYRMLAYMDYPTLLMFFTGLGAGLHIWRTGFKQVPALFLVWNIIATLLIFMSPGTVTNHLLDLFVAALIVTVASMVHDEGLSRKTGIIFLALIALFGVETSLERMGRQWTKHLNRHSVYQRAAEMTGTGTGPILSENPMIPVVKGQSPYLADPYIFKLLSRRKPELRDQMAEKLNKAFSAPLFWPIAPKAAP